MNIFTADMELNTKMLDGIDGFIFNLPLKEIKASRTLDFFNALADFIIDGDKEHSILVIEEPRRKYHRNIKLAIAMLNRRINDVKDKDFVHSTHIFFSNSDIFPELLKQFDGLWDNSKLKYKET